MTVGATLVGIILICGALSNSIVGLLVFLRNSQAALNRYFFYLCLSSTFWITTNFVFQLTDNIPTKYAVALASYTSAGLIAVFFYLFAKNIRKSDVSRKGHQLLVLSGTFVSVAATMPGVVSKGISSSGEILTNRLPLAIFGIVLVCLMVRGIFLLMHNLKNADPLERKKVSIIIAGLSLGAIIGVICNLLLPMAGNYKLVGVGPIGSLFFIVFTAYAMIRHKMFDMRSVVARALGYTTAMLFIAVVYGSLVFGSARWIFDLHVSMLVQFVLSIVTGLAGLMFYRLQHTFDRLTNRAFYRDAYDSARLFDSLNTILVSSLKLDYLLRKTAELLVDDMRLRFAAFVVEDSNGKIKVFGSDGHKISAQLFEEIVDKSQGMRGATIVADYLEDEATTGLRRFLDSHNIAVVVPLYSSIRRHKKSIGYMVMGSKQSGSFYTAQDLRVVETVANELVIAIQNSLHFEEIQNFNVTLQTRVDEATRQLRQTNHKLQQLDETKDDFISMASHQLRTPLTSVKGYISMVLEGDAGKLNASQRAMLQQSYTSSQRMVYLIADLLNVSRLKTGKFVVDATPTDLTHLLKEEIDQLKETAAVRSIKLSLNAPAAFPPLMLDETKTRQVIMNFLDNAIYYTPPGGHIEVKLIDKPDTIELHVVDNGIGVPKDEQHRLFNKFYRAKNAQRARPDGTGLGLFMAKKVIVAQGGSLLFTSREGKGSTFGFIFSKSKLKVPA